MSVGARVLKYQIHRAYARPAPVTIKIYSDPGASLDTVDGYAERTGDLQTWDQIHDGAGTGRDFLGINSWALIIASMTEPRWRQIIRHKCTFDLVNVPVGSDIQIVTYNVWVLTSNNTLGGSPTIALFTSPVPPYNNVLTTDYPGFGSTPISDVVNLALIPTNVWQKWTVTDANLGLFVPGQKVAIGIREAAYDAADGAPPWVAGASIFISFATVDHPTVSIRPYLEVTYQPP